MSPVVEIPQHVLLVSMAALHAGGTADHAADAVAMSQALREPALESSANPYRLTPEPFFDALTGLRADTRFATFARRIFKTTAGEAYVPVEIDARLIPMLRRDPIIARH